MSKLWQKSNYVLSEIIEKFTVGDDYKTDMALVIWDIVGNIAQSKMLNKINLISKDELKSVINALNKIISEYLNNNLIIKIEDEDVHTKIEKELIKLCGETGKKIHTGRSRNDQVLVDMRLLCKDALLSSVKTLLDFINTLIQYAKKYEFVPMPGYTHMQRGMPSSIGMWALSFAEELIDNLKIFDSIYSINDMCPLGSGAGYGISIPVEREYVSELLGFSRVQINSLYCQNSRGKVEMKIAYYLMDTASVFKRIASDLLLFTTQEYAFFKASDTITTGSSIMPQKRNLDVMELVRGKHSRFVGILNELISLSVSLPSGYNRDLQETKKTIINAFSLFIEICEVMDYSFSQLEPIEENLINAMSPDIFATDYAYKLVLEKGIPFRDAYKEIGDNINNLKKLDPSKRIKERKHIGSTGKLMINNYETNIKNISEKYYTEHKKFYEKIFSLLNQEV